MTRQVYQPSLPLASEFTSSPTQQHIRPKKKRLIYDLRFTIYDLESSARGAREAAKQMRTGCDEAVIGRGYKGAEAGGAWPFTMDDGRWTIAMFARAAQVFSDH